MISVEMLGSSDTRCGSSDGHVPRTERAEVPILENKMSFWSEL